MGTLSPQNSKFSRIIFPLQTRTTFFSTSSSSSDPGNFDYRRKPSGKGAEADATADENEVFDDQENLKGMALVFRRATNILEAVTERKGTSLLNIYCGGEMLGFFGNIINATYLSVTGVTDKMEMLQSCRDIPIFSEVVHAKDASILPFDEKMFQVITCLRPSDGKHIPVKELSRVTNDEGVIIYGAFKKQWDGENLMVELSSFSKAELISVQDIDCQEQYKDSYYLAILRNK